MNRPGGRWQHEAETARRELSKHASRLSRLEEIADRVTPEMVVGINGISCECKRCEGVKYILPALLDYKESRDA